MKKGIRGLSDTEVLELRKKYGSNSLTKEKSKGIIRRFFENLNDPIIKILIISLVLELIFTFGHANLFEVFGIVAAILLATTVSTVSEYGSERAFEKMSEDDTDSRVKVLRNGEPTEILLSEIVAGDVVYLSSGDIIPADGIIVSGRVSVDQSALNGESREVSKYYRKDKLERSLSSETHVFRGTVITVGEAVMRVEAVGSATYYGMVARDVQSETRISPLKLRLGRLAAQISRIGYVMAFLLAIVYLFNTLIVDNLFDTSLIISHIKDPQKIISTLAHALTLMITVIVVAVPEGLPMMITVVLSANMKKMIRDNVLVKKLVGIETAGSLNLLFTDKTGTITTGIPRCDKIITANSAYKSISSLKKAGGILDALIISARYNTASIESRGEVISGNGTDRAILAFFKNERFPALEVIKREPFSSETKTSSVAFSDGRSFVKGAPELIIKKCRYSLTESGAIAAFDLQRTATELKEATRGGNRVIAVAYSDNNTDGLIFVALIVLKDMLKRDSRDAIVEMKRAGVQIVMMTGDARETAEAIAYECGIIDNKADLVITSEELSKMTDDEVKDIIPRLRVLARALPQDKTRLVRLSQEMDLVVGMTGDGVNDAPSLKLADVGFAMGNGTDIAKCAGDIVIRNNSLTAINKTILYGRTIFKSIRKFITFQLIMNFAACGVSLIGQLIGIDSPITIIQMLWVNIIMDTLGGLAFAGEPAIEKYMLEKPKSRRESLLTKEMIANIAISGVYTLLLCIGFLRLGCFTRQFVGANSSLRHMTAFYALFIFLGIFNCFIARSEDIWIFKGILQNKLFVLIMSFISVIQIAMIYLGGSIFRTVPLHPIEILRVIALGFSIIPIEIIRRIFKRLK